MLLLAWTSISILLFLQINDYSQRGLEVKFSHILILLRCLRVSFNNIALHQTVSLAYSFLNQFFNYRLLNKLLIQEGLLNFSSSYRISSYLITYEITCWDIDQVVKISEFFGQSCSATVWCSYYQDMRACSWRSTCSLNIESSLNIWKFTLS